jgi:sulfite reductase beta subunit-like hemoprotein
MVAGRSWIRTADPLPAVKELADRCAKKRVRSRELGLRLAPVGAEVRTSWCGVRTVDGVVAAHAVPAFGVMSAADARLLSALSAASVDIRPTPERGVLAVADRWGADVVRDAVDELARRGWVVDDDDPRRMVSACIGSRGCGASLIDTWDVAAGLVGDHAGGLGVGGRTHVSGCIKQCGAPVGVRHVVATPAGVVERAK